MQFGLYASAKASLPSWADKLGECSMMSHAERAEIAAIARGVDYVARVLQDNPEVVLPVPATMDCVCFTVAEYASHLSQVLARLSAPKR